MNRKNALGRGLGALIPAYLEEKVDKEAENFTEPVKLSTQDKPDVEKTVDNDGKVFQLPLSKVEPRSSQPRVIFDEKALKELADSIKEHGLLQPILVAKAGDHYEIIAGERRWRAAKLAGLKKIPALLGEYDDRTRMELALIENIQREDLNAIEEAQAYRQLIDEYHLKQDELAARLSKSRVTISNSLRLLRLDERVQAMLMDGSLSEGHARALLGISDKKKQLEAAKTVAEKKLSVRETERLVRHLQQPAAEKPQTETWRADDQSAYDALALSLRKSLGTKVSIHRTDKEKGQLVIDYYSVEELERITERLK